MLRRPGEIARFEWAAQLDSILAFTKLRLGARFLALAGCFVFRQPLDRSLFLESRRWTVFRSEAWRLPFFLWR